MLYLMCVTVVVIIQRVAGICVSGKSKTNPEIFTVEFQKICFDFHAREAGWDEAASVCADDKKVLVKITNARRWAFVYEVINLLAWNTSWIGANDLKTSSVWLWHGKTKADIFFRKDEAPDPTAHCAMLYSTGQAKARDCADKANFICMTVKGKQV
ncbi:galactose-specific lectin nattectin-like [Physella acuta]|uniref:galactose-specific lectin nattectin-like n=1 Tax=Physella acuta TaxID=109671 RepID=UPI0027DD2F66|nr:galactose-specific lectin nattectin-like [Physella acuta]XP_059155758.1 galactose-specific lectin nattectin-like [Physella acuta]